MGVYPRRGSGEARGRVRREGRGRRAVTDIRLRRPQAVGAGRRRPAPHEEAPQGAASRTRQTPQSTQESREEGKEEVRHHQRTGRLVKPLFCQI